MIPLQTKITSINCEIGKRMWIPRWFIIIASRIPFQPTFKAEFRASNFGNRDYLVGFYSDRIDTVDTFVGGLLSKGCFVSEILP